MPNIAPYQQIYLLGIGGRGPDEGLGLSVMMMNETIDFYRKVLDAPKSASTNSLMGNQIEPDPE